MSWKALDKGFFLAVTVLAVLPLVAAGCSSGVGELAYGTVAPFPANGDEANQAVYGDLLELAEGHGYGMQVWEDYQDRAVIKSAYCGDYEAGYKHDGWQIIHVIEQQDIDDSSYLQGLFEGTQPTVLYDADPGWLLEWHASPSGWVEAWNDNALRLEAELLRD